MNMGGGDTVQAPAVAITLRLAWDPQYKLAAPLSLAPWTLSIAPMGMIHSPLTVPSQRDFFNHLKKRTDGVSTLLDSPRRPASRTFPL